ncbi:MAG TPA: Mth938-like domain-containing protein [Candidatus Competibacteraceae bacterium]|nr:Mth938-like domain-containing protein [Candidatus Competibacteraceae bacterium]
MNNSHYHGTPAMRLHQDLDPNTVYIRAYATGSVTVSDRVLTRSAVITPDGIHDWAPQTFAELSEEHFADLLELNPEIVLLGTGARQRFPHPSLTRALLARGIGVEVMDTAAACRTYNIILAEGRRVVAALLMI